MCLGLHRFLMYAAGGETVLVNDVETKGVDPHNYYVFFGHWCMHHAEML